MDPRSIVSSPLDTFSPQKALGLANLYMETATNTGDPETVLMLCYDTEVSLSQARKTVKRAEDQALILEIAAAYFDLGTVLEKSGYNTEAQASFKMAGELGENLQGISSRFKGISLDSQATGTQHSAIARALAHIFPEDINPPTLKLKLPDPDERLQSTRQLVCCLGILQTVQSADLSLEPAAQQWVQVIEDDTDEQDRLYSMATDLIRVFKRDELKDARAITEIVSLAPVLDKEEFQGLLREFYSGTNSSGLLDVHQLMGLAQMIQGADSSYLGTDDLVKILGLFSDQLRDTHHQSQGYMYKLTLAISYVLDAMADTNVIDLDRKRLHEPLLLYLEELKKSSDPYLVYQAAYAFQALLCVSDDETVWQGAMGRSGKVFQGVAGLVSAAKGLDLNKFIEGLEHMQEGTSNIVDVVQSAYKNVTSLAESGQGFLDCLKDGLSFDCKRDWYSALRGADALIREGKFASFRMLVCGAPCRLDAAFQWGVCQRLGEISSDPRWDAPTRRGAIDFLGEMYKNDDMWGQQSDIKQWILNVLMQMTTLSGKGHKCKQSRQFASNEMQIPIVLLN
ncbi:hypothetical protein BGX31_007277 [Mortierella sp. GBA43]|nr:hypothetical protein BGX31_007277 [Mortierella sp. GBA43]